MPADEFDKGFFGALQAVFPQQFHVAGIVHPDNLCRWP